MVLSWADILDITADHAHLKTGGAKFPAAKRAALLRALGVGKLHPDWYDETELFALIALIKHTDPA
jgi:hypothetical protein